LLDAAKPAIEFKIDAEIEHFELGSIPPALIIGPRPLG